MRISSSTAQDIVSGQWQNAEKKHINSARLEETIYFALRVQWVKNGDKVKLQLYEYHSIMPDSDTFNRETIVKEVTINDNVGILEYKLPKEWKQEIEESSGHRKTVYFKAKIEGKEWKKIDKYLSIYPSATNLFVRASPYNDKFPEMYTYEGLGLAVVSLIQDQTTGTLRDRAIAGTTKIIEQKIVDIAVAELEKGHLAATNGSVYDRKRIYLTKAYDIEGNIQVVSKGKNFGFLQKGKVENTSAINQVEYFTHNGPIVKLLRFTKMAMALGQPMWDVFSLGKFMNDVRDGKIKPLTIPGAPPVLNVAAEASGIIASELVAKWDADIAEIDQNMLDQAKAYGIAGVREFISQRNADNKQIPTYLLRAISQETASQIMQGYFNTYYDLYNQFIQTRTIPPNSVYVLIKRLPNQEMYIIESFFVNE